MFAHISDGEAAGVRIHWRIYWAMGYQIRH
jgi:hypothetical protein